MAWVRQVHFAQVAREAAMLDYLHEVDHMSKRVRRLEQAITEAVKLAAPAVQEVVKGLQALRGIAELSAVTIVAELGNITRFDTARQLMGYSGAVPSEVSSGQRTRRGSITKTGNAHLRLIVVEVAWSKMYGKGRVFYSTLGHTEESWQDPDVRKMYFEAIKWALQMTEGSTASHPRPAAATAGR